MTPPIFDPTHDDSAIPELLSEALDSPAPRPEFVSELNERLREVLVERFASSASTPQKLPGVIAPHPSEDGRVPTFSATDKTNEASSISRRAMALNMKGWFSGFLTGSVSLLALFAVYFAIFSDFSASRAYSWDRMLRSMSEEGWLEISEISPSASESHHQTSPSGHMWVDLAQRRMAVRNSQLFVYKDYRQHQLYDYDPATGQVFVTTNSRLMPGDSALFEDNDLATLLSCELSERTPEHPCRFELISESFRKIDTPRGKMIELVVRFQETNPPQTPRFLELTCLLNPDTDLPVQCQMTDLNQTSGEPVEQKAYSMKTGRGGPETIYQMGIEEEVTVVLNDPQRYHHLSSRSSNLTSTSGVVLLNERNALADPNTSLKGESMSSINSSETLSPVTAETTPVEIGQLVDHLEQAPRLPPSSQVAMLDAAKAKPQDVDLNVSTELRFTPLLNAISSTLQVPSTSTAMSQQIDSLLEQAWQVRAITPAHTTGDQEFTRRLYLDLLGRIPTVAEARQLYRKNETLDRTELISRLLSHPDFSSYLASVWRQFLLPDAADLTRFGGTQAFESWLRIQFAANRRYDELVSELLLSQGRVNESGPVLFYTALELKPDEIAKQTCRAFLGMRIDCAQCHDHPFDHWKQEEFWGMAAFFSRISRPEGKMEMLSPLLQVRDNMRGDVRLPDSETIVPPRFLMGETFNEEQVSHRRAAFVGWLVQQDNHQFAKATVNRVWAHLFGRGIVDPVDDMGEHNPPLIPELLDALALFFIQSDYDLNLLITTICQSKAYQLSSQSASSVIASDESEDPARWFARMNLKTLSAEQLYDCIAIATHREVNSSVPADVTQNIGLQRIGSASREEFIQQFQSTGGAIVDYQAGIPQALTLMNGAMISNATDLSRSGVLASVMAPFFTDSQRIETLFLATLSRQPTLDERDAIEEMLTEFSDPDAKKQLWGDLFWALLNSSEFTFNH